MEQTDSQIIRIPYPKAKEICMKIIVPVCSLVISPGLGNIWVTGKYNDPNGVMPLNINQTANSVHLVCDGAFGYRVPAKMLPEMRLSFGRLHPFGLSISTGDLPNQCDFGGIPLSSLDIQYGAGTQMIDFSYPNPYAMKQMKVEAANGPIQMDHISHAHAAEIKIKGDSTCYRLHFGGEIKQDTSLIIGMGVASVEISLPTQTAVKIKSGIAPTGSVPGDFFYSDKTYWNQAAKDHQEPLLSIQNTASASPLKFHFSE